MSEERHDVIDSISALFSEMKTSDNTANLVAGAFSLAASLVKVAVGYASASASRRAELVAQAEADFDGFLALMKDLDEAIEKLNADIDQELEKS